jgi:hypothetical protein
MPDLPLPSMKPTSNFELWASVTKERNDLLTCVTESCFAAVACALQTYMHFAARSGECMVSEESRLKWALSTLDDVACLELRITGGDGEGKVEIKASFAKAGT